MRTFYDRVRDDDLLGPLFEAWIGDWPSHLHRMCAYWSSMALATDQYHGQPMVAHFLLPVDARHFDRWLEIFKETAREICPPPAAERFYELAVRIAMSLELGVARRCSIVLKPGQRLKRPDSEVYLPGNLCPLPRGAVRRSEERTEPPPPQSPTSNEVSDEDKEAYEQFRKGARRHVHHHRRPAK